MNFLTLLEVIRIIRNQGPGPAGVAQPGQGWVKWQSLGSWQKASQGRPCAIVTCSVIMSSIFISCIVLLLVTFILNLL